MNRSSALDWQYPNRRSFLRIAGGALTGWTCSSSMWAAEPAAPSPKFLLAWGKKGNQPGEFHSPIGLTINQADELFVTDVNNARVQKFSSDGKFLASFDLPHDSPPRISCQAAGIAIDGKGHLYISMMMKHKIGVFTDAGKLIREWGKHGKGNGEFNQPGGMAMAVDGSLYVADQINHRVQRFRAEGEYLAQWGEYGKKPGQFDGVEPASTRFGGPHFLAIDSKGNLFTTEGVLGRVQQFTPEGKPLQAWGDKGTQPGGFGGLANPYSANTFGPIGICADKQDRVWVSSLNNRVQCYTAQGKYLMGVGGTGSEPGQFRMPHAMVVDSRGCLYVADSGNNRIQKFELPAVP